MFVFLCAFVYKCKFNIRLTTVEPRKGVYKNSLKYSYIFSVNKNFLKICQDLQWVKQNTTTVTGFLGRLKTIYVHPLEQCLHTNGVIIVHLHQKIKI